MTCRLLASTCADGRHLGSRNEGRRCSAFLEVGSTPHRTARTQPPCPSLVRIWLSRDDPLHERRTVNPPIVRLLTDGEDISERLPR
jgi:hypothetical protein